MIAYISRYVKFSMCGIELRIVDSVLGWKVGRKEPWNIKEHAARFLSEGAVPNNTPL
jgi:hypothetical protein